MNISRRKFLMKTMGVAGAFALMDTLRLAKATSATPLYTDRYFVFANFLGGWDAILTTDPKDPELYNDTELTVAEYGVETGYSALGLDPDPRIFTDVEDLILGPYIGGLENFANRISVVRGMTVTSVAHVAAQMHLFTGKVPAGLGPRASSIATILASILGAEQLIPNLVAGVPSYNLDRPSWASALKADRMSDLQDLLSPGLSALDIAERDALDEFFEREAARMDTPRMGSIFDNRELSRGLIEENVAEDFSILNPALDTAVENLGNTTALMAYQALTQGYSRCVSFKAMPFSDAHNGSFWRNLHRWHLQGGFNQVAALAAELEATPYPTGGSWLDKTTIICCSEFNRSPFLNQTGGRDHAATNSCLLLGGGIAGGKVIGASHAKNMAAQAIDLQTGAVDENGSTVSVENIAATLIKSLGIEEDIGDYRVPTIDALLV